MNLPKKLIEVAMPIKEISAESVRDKSIRHGHISTLHLWWARRPLPVCRAVIFASLVPDPLDENCSQAFKDAVETELGPNISDGNIYKPYDDIPYTAGIDKMDDNLRNRLLMFIGKFSLTYIRNEHLGKPTPAKDQLSDASLIKWDNKNNEAIINKARRLIWVAYNTQNGKNSRVLLSQFDLYFNSIKEAEKALYAYPDRHLSTKEVRTKELKLNVAIEAFLERMPKVFDPFAGGGAIPLEAARLGCRSYGNDINPVAHIIQKGSLEFPQKFGKTIVYTKEEFLRLYGEESWEQQPQENYVSKVNVVSGIRINNRLSFDVEYFAKKLLVEAEKEIGHLYPADEKGNKPIAYYWARVGICSNPTCKAEVPLLKQFYLANTKTKQVHLKPIIEEKSILFEIKKGKYDEQKIKSWVDRGNMSCPCCGNPTDVKTLKAQFINGKTKEKILAVIEEGPQGKQYRMPTKSELAAPSKVPSGIERPQERMPVEYTQALPSCTWGLEKWGDMFSNRQLYAIQTFIQVLQKIKVELSHLETEYQRALITYLAIWIDRIVVVNTSFGRWHVSGEKLEHPFSKQAIPMMFDYPESNMFCKSTGSALNQLEWLKRYIESESQSVFYSNLINASSGEKSQFNEKFLTATITDPPYYDAIAYADLSDFFYVWLKRTLGDIYPLNFSTPQTPKSEECTALKHHHNNSRDKAKIHFENKLTQIFDSIEHQTSDIVSIMFAHQSTEAWTTLCNSILDARMNITGSWAMDTEMANRSLGLAGAVLESSVTVSCKPSQREGIGNFQEVKKAIEKKVVKEVSLLYKLGFRGADLLTACFGQAVSEFGNYEKVEKADGSEVTVAELLEIAKECAFNALVKGFTGDEYTKFYIGWLQLYGFMESDFDDAAKFSRVGLSIDVADLFKDHLFTKNGNKQSLAGFKERNMVSKYLGDKQEGHLIDQVHRTMMLSVGKDRKLLLQYIAKVASNPDSPFWRVVTSLVEILPTGSEDHKASLDLLANKDNLIRESRDLAKTAGEQSKLEF